MNKDLQEIFGKPEPSASEEKDFNVSEPGLFDIIKDMNMGSSETWKFFKDNSRLPKNYNQYMINTAFSNTMDTVLWANDVNLYYDLPDLAHLLYYRGCIKPKKRFGKWYKSIKDETVSHLAELLNCTCHEVRSNYHMIPKEIIDELEQDLHLANTYSKMEKINDQKTRRKRRKAD